MKLSKMQSNVIGPRALLYSEPLDSQPTIANNSAQEETEEGIKIKRAPQKDMEDIANATEDLMNDAGIAGGR